MRSSLALLLLAMLSCSGDEPTAGGGVSGTFDLVTIDGHSPPRIELINMAQDTLFTVGGELRVLSRGRISAVRRRQWHSSATGPGPVDADTVIAEYRLSGTELLLDYPASDRAAYTDTAVVSDGAITVRTKIYGFELGTVFVRNYRYNER